MNNQEVLHNLRRLSVFDDMDPYEPLSKPHNCPRYDSFLFNIELKYR